MGPDLTSLPRTTTCPACGGALRPEATWCSLCYADFRTAAAPVVPVAEPPSAVPPAAPAAPRHALPYDGLDPLTGPLLDLALPVAPPPVPVPVAVPAPAAQPAAEVLAPPVVAPEPAAPAAAPGWPCGRCGETNPLSTTICLVCASPFLSGATERPTFVVPGVGDLGAMSRGQRAALAGMVVAAVLAVVALLTFLMTGSSAHARSGSTSSVAPATGTDTTGQAPAPSGQVPDTTGQAPAATGLAPVSGTGVPAGQGTSP